MITDPNTPLKAVTDMREDWVIVDALMGGTKAMRAAGGAFLEQFPEEANESFTRRLKRSTLLPVYSETVGRMTGRVFADPIALGDKVPDTIKALAQNFDNQGNNLQVWAQSLFATALSHGLCHVLVDYPKTTDSEGRSTTRTVAQEQAAKVRPYAVMIRPQQVIGWLSSDVEGDHSLTQFWYMEAIEEPDGPFGIKVIPQIRVLVPGGWAVYQEVTGLDGKKTWVLMSEGTNSLQVIPISTLYTKRTGFMTATPPLLELAHLNVKHWNEQSDQDKSVRFARIRLAVLIGVDDDSLTKVKISSDSMLNLPLGSDVKVVQGSAESVSIGRSELQALVDDMRMAGGKLLQKDKQPVKTATQATSESAEELSPLQTMAGQLEDALDQILQFFALWMNLPDGGNVKVNGNFEVDFTPEISLPLLLNMAAQGRLSDQTLFGEYQRRGIISEDIDWDVEKQKIADQGPALGAL